MRGAVTREAPCSNTALIYLCIEVPRVFKRAMCATTYLPSITWLVRKPATVRIRSTGICESPCFVCMCVCVVHFVLCSALCQGFDLAKRWAPSGHPAGPALHVASRASALLGGSCGVSRVCSSHAVCVPTCAGGAHVPSPRHFWTGVWMGACLILGVLPAFLGQDPHLANFCVCVCVVCVVREGQAL